MDSTVYLRPDRCYYRSRAIRVDGPEVDRSFLVEETKLGHGRSLVSRKLITKTCQ
jgi:hypothetical protein